MRVRQWHGPAKRAYKRWTQVLSLSLALILAVGFNVDSIRIGQELWAQPVMAQQIATNSKIVDLSKDIPNALSQMNHTIPVGWSDDKPASLPLAILGWLITALATLFGAPFWFDVLQSITRLKGSGPSPDEKTSNRSASA